MFRRHYNLALAGLWLGIAVCLVFPEVLPDKVQKQVRVPFREMAVLLALAFAAYNVVRWWAYQTLYRSQAEAAKSFTPRRPEEPEPYVPNPELDFLKIPDPDEPESSSGERRP